MKEGRKGRRKILTIIIGGVIAAILAAIAVPLYTGYVERARVSEGYDNVRAIITSQKVGKVRTTKFYSASTIAEFKARGIDITDTKFFTYETVATPNGGFTVTATTTDAFGAGGGSITYTYDPAKGGRWGSDEVIILNDMLLLQT